ncbi:ion channel [candidate division CSSED10-310 bacterium]|uniref:Ion channel n=1 Tax=candidate division CSSED10-310 bacterium TaxID=2855610 RepID=A0ABV6YWP7_UNCC1
MWWSTVGYGDKAPQTVSGRIVAVIWMFTAVIIISSFTAAITSSLTITQFKSIVKGPSDLYRVRVGVVQNTTGEQYLKAQNITYITFPSASEGLLALHSAQIDAFVYDAPLLRYIIHEEFNRTLQVLPQKLVYEDYGIVLPQGSPWREKLNQVLLRKISNPSWENILERYFGS